MGIATAQLQEGSALLHSGVLSKAQGEQQGGVERLYVLCLAPAWTRVMIAKINKNDRNGDEYAKPPIAVIANRGCPGISVSDFA